MRKFNLLKKSCGRVEKLIQQYDDDYPLNRGWGNGYVFLSPEHPLYGKDHDILNHIINIHNGLSFSEPINAIKCKNWGVPNKYIGWWCVGFDTSHFADTITDWPKEEVEKETEYLAQQFKKYL